MSNVCVTDLNGTYKVASDSLAFRPAIYAVIIRDDMVLLMQVKDKFWLPGGGIERGENHMDALQREVMEETGITVRPVKLLNVYSSMYRSFDGDANYHCIQIYYVCEIVDAGHNVSFTSEEQKYLKPGVWVKISELNNYPYAGTETIFSDIQQYYNSSKVGEN